MKPWNNKINDVFQLQPDKVFYFIFNAYVQMLQHAEKSMTRVEPSGESSDVAFALLMQSALIFWRCIKQNGVIAFEVGSYSYSSTYTGRYRFNDNQRRWIPR